MEFEQVEKKLNESDIFEFEKKINTILPKDFANHYLIWNGGYPPFEYVKGINNIFTINGFNPIKYGALPIEQLIKDYAKSGIFFEDKVPFAYDNGGNVYLVSQNSEIHIIESEFLENKNYILVSKTFTDFLNSMYNE